MDEKLFEELIRIESEETAAQDFALEYPELSVRDRLRVRAEAISRLGLDSIPSVWPPAKAAELGVGILLVNFRAGCRIF